MQAGFRRVAPPNGTFDGGGEGTAVPEKSTRKPEFAGATRIVCVGMMVWYTLNPDPGDIGWHRQTVRLTVGKFTAVQDESTRKPEFAGATRIVCLAVVTSSCARFIVGTFNGVRPFRPGTC